MYAAATCHSMELIVLIMAAMAAMVAVPVLTGCVCAASLLGCGLGVHLQLSSLCNVLAYFSCR